MRSKLMALALALVALAAGSARGDFTLLDDFNRADSATLGPGWTLRAGSIGVAGGMAAGGSGTSLATFDGASSTVVTADIFATAGAPGVALMVLGYADPAHCLTVGIASNADGFFDTTVLHFGVDGANDPLWRFAGVFLNFPAPYAFRSARMTAEVADGYLTIWYDIDFDGRRDRGVSIPSLPTAGLLGSGIGLAMSGGARIDNFGVGVPAIVPEPSSLALASLAGLVAAGVALRARRAGA